MHKLLLKREVTARLVYGQASLRKDKFAFHQVLVCQRSLPRGRQLQIDIYLNVVIRANSQNTFCSWSPWWVYFSVHSSPLSTAFNTVPVGKYVLLVYTGLFTSSKEIRRRPLLFLEAVLSSLVNYNEATSCMYKVIPLTRHKEHYNVERKSRNRKAG